MPTPSAADAAVARFRHDLTALTGPISDRGRIGIAVSGGPDSLALLLLAHAAIPGQIMAATVDHGLRREAAAEAEAVAGICAARGIPHAILHPPEPIETSGNIQERARVARYRLLAEWSEGNDLAIIATAHHRDDVAEGFLMRALRRSGVGGLARMAGHGAVPHAGQTTVRLVRPLLDWSRAELGEIAATAGLEAAQDPSNEDIRYDRVQIRKLLGREPMLDAEALAKAAANLADAEAAIAWMTEQVWRSRAVIEGEAALTIDTGDLPIEIRRRLAERAVATLTPEWNGDGLEGLLTRLDAGTTSTLAGVKASGGESWRFTIAPPRTHHH